MNEVKKSIMNEQAEMKNVGGQLPFHQTNINFHSHSNLMFVFDSISIFDQQSRVQSQ